MPSIAETFFSLIEEGKIEEVKQLILTQGMDLNYVSPSTGRTALHLAYIHDHEELQHFLISQGALPQIKDKARYIPFDYRLVTVKTTGFPDRDRIDAQRQVVLKQFIEEVNEAGFNLPLIYVPHFEELADIVRAQTQTFVSGSLYLIVSVPPFCSPETASIHVVPIIYNFNKEQGQDCYIILDSAYSGYIPLPKISKAHPTSVFFSPYHLQVSGDGCFNYCQTVLLHAFLDPNLMQFLRENSLLGQLYKGQYGDHLDIDFINQAAQIRYPNMCFFNDYSSTFSIKLLPPWMYLYLQNYKTVRLFMTLDPLMSQIKEKFPGKISYRAAGCSDFNMYRFSDIDRINPRDIIEDHLKVMEHSIPVKSRFFSTAKEKCLSTPPSDQSTALSYN